MIGFRVTNQMVLDHVLTNFQANEQQLQIEEQKVSSGQAFSRPSDAPFAASQAVTLRQRIGLNEQLQRNLDQAQGWLQATDSALGSITDNLQRARQLALQAANDTNTPSDRQKIADEIHQLLLSTVDIGNSAYGGQYLFGGTKTTAQPFVHDGSAHSPNLAGTPGLPAVVTGGAMVTANTALAGTSTFTVTGPRGSQLFNTASYANVGALMQAINGANLGVAASISPTGDFQIASLATGSNQTVTLSGGAGTDYTNVLGLPAAGSTATGVNALPASKSPVTYLGDTGAVTRQIDQASQLQINADGTQLTDMMNTLAQLEYDLNNSTTRVSGDITGIDPVNGRLTGSPNVVSTFTINGVAIGTQQSTVINGQDATIIGFSPGTLISTVVNQINQQIGSQVHASVDANGVLVLQSMTGQPVVVSNVDQATTDAVTGADLTGGTGNPVSTGGSTAQDLGLTNGMDNTIGSADVAALDKSLASVEAMESDVGAKTNRVQSGQSRLQTLGVTLASLDSSVEDVDMAQALSDLATSQTTFQAALGAAAKVLPPTLLDFLR